MCHVDGERLQRLHPRRRILVVCRLHRVGTLALAKPQADEVDESGEALAPGLLRRI
jgi:hypothetical protein